MTATGLDASASSADIEVRDDGVLLTVDPRVAGRPTAGMPVAVAAGPDGVRTASGWLADPVEGEAYPLVGARDAIDAASTPSSPTSSSAVTEATVVAVELGLSLEWSQDGRPLLVPAWLLDVDGAPRPVPVVAVDPAYLGAPGGGTAVPAEPGGGAGDEAGSPGRPGPVRPPDGGSAPGQPGTRYETVVLDRTGRSLTARFYGGVEDCYDYRLTAEESPRRVVLHLRETSTTDGVCIELAQEYERTVQLRNPLGDRVVVDAETGHQVLLRRPRD